MKMLSTIIMASLLTFCSSRAAEPIKFDKPDMNRGTSTMQALSERQSTREFADRPLSTKDLGDLLWAANGINRPESGNRTAPSALNSQQIKIYVATAEGTYLYNHKNHSLDPIAVGDYRQGARTDKPAVDLVLVADNEEIWAGLDAGHVSENIYLFCAANGMATVCCGSMDKDSYRKAFALAENQKPIIHLPVGYKK